jgi:hypothetical protein
MKTPQRDVNLARRLVRIGNQTLGLGAELLLDPIKQPELDSMLTQLENGLLDAISACREYRRKVNPIELKGQRA